MLLAAILLLYPFPQSVDVEKAVTERPASVSVDTAKDSSLSTAMPTTPEPKIKTDAEVAENSNPAPLSAAAAAEPAVPGGAPLAIRPVKAAAKGEYGTQRQKKIWYTLMFASSGAAAFDAWTTRRAISGGYGTETNPMLRPFVHSPAIYVATQVSPLVLDFVGRKMMTSRRELFRRMWWLPQSAGMGTSLGAGANNMAVVASH
jgi:hypothetical protein